MHIVVRESRDLDEAATPQDLGLAPADVVFLSFSDSDLAMAAAAFRSVAESERPSLRVANLNVLRHPMSVDLFADTTLNGTKAVLVRLLGGLDYWRYGGEQLGRRCREHGISLAIVAGDGRPDIRLAALSTVGAEDLARLEALLDAGGVENTRVALRALLARADRSAEEIPSPRDIPAFGIYREGSASISNLGTAAVVFYRSHLLAGDVAPVDALVDALDRRGLATTALYVPSLKAPDAATWVERELGRLSPSVIINATAFAARDGTEGSPLDDCGCPVLQVALANSSRTVWENSQRGLSASDLAMHVVLPEFDGRLFAGVISFKEEDDLGRDLGMPLVRHAPHEHGIEHVADLAAAWAKLRTSPRDGRRVGLLLSTYPGRPDQIAHAVGLDGLQSACRIASRLQAEGYSIPTGPAGSSDLVERLGDERAIRWPLESYQAAFAKLPQAFRASVAAAWGEPEDDFLFRVVQFGNLLIGLQPERGQVQDRKAQYHDPSTPPRHSYVAFYLWLRHVAKIDALIHLGAHGTLEWLPGKAVAGSDACAPRALLGPVPMIYPFIVNDPGEAAQAKRRLSAVTLGHRPPPMTEAGLSGPLSEVERLVDEFSSADGLDPRRRKVLSGQIVDAAVRAGIAERCGVETGMAASDALMRIDAFLCDVKELAIRDGLHVLDDTELDAIVRVLDGRFVEPGPAGAPSRGRSDVLPTGRNLYSVDPRSVPTPTAWANGKRAAKAILDRYLSDHGDWPRAIVLDLWGSATLRTGGEELATALALLGVRPVWDQRSYRVTGIETEALAELGRPRVDVTLRISGLFRDMFGVQLTLFDSAVALVAGLPEDEADNPLRGAARREARLDRIFGPAGGSFGAGVMQHIDRGDWSKREDLGRSYIENSAEAYRSESSSAVGSGFEDRVRAADAFVHVQDHSEIDLLTGGDFAAHEGGFAAAAAALGNSDVALYHGDTAAPETPRIRTLQEECARVIHGRAANTRWIEGQMRHGFRGGAEMAQSVDAAFAFAATARTVDNGGFERLYEAYLGDPAVAAFLARENPAAIEAMRSRFEEAIARGLWQPRRNDLEMGDREADIAARGCRMTSAAHLRKGWCPGALRPMRSGDGLLVRVKPRAGAFSLAALRTIAAVAARFGSGEIDLTSRGNLQLRGVADETYEAAIAGLDGAGLIDQSSAAEAVRNVVVDPLSGIDPLRANVRDIAAALEDVLVRDPRFWSLPGKFGFSFSGNAEPRVGGRLADIMIAAEGDQFAVCLDGAADIVCDVSRDETVGAAQHLALVFLELRGNDSRFMRVRDAVARIGAANFFAMAGLGAKSRPSACAAASSAPVGMLVREKDLYAVGIGLPFGRIVADQLDALCQASSPAAKLDCVHTSPERVLVFPMRDREAGAALLAAADRAGLIAAGGDVRLTMDVCPGAPSCANASTDTRGDAQRLVEVFRPSPGGYSLHVSGCEKGCARRGTADFTLVARRGDYDIIRDGGAGDPVLLAGVKPDDIGDAISRFIMETAS